MKKLILLAVSVVMSLAANAADVIEIDGIYYNIISEAKGAEVIKNPKKYSGYLKIPESITYNEIEYGVNIISVRAFEGCKELTGISVPASISSIGENAFSGCESLSRVDITDIEAWCGISFGGNIRYHPNFCNPLSYAHHLYLNGNEIKELIIPESVEAIGNYAFSGCEGLTKVTIPNSVKSIGGWAFDECNGLTSLEIPSGVTEIKQDAFSRCRGLTSVIFSNTVTTIDSYAFYECINLKSLILSNSLTTIGDYAFYGCSGLTSLNIPSSVILIYTSAFSHCGLTSITIGENAYISSGVFSNNPNLIDVYCFNERVPSANTDAFNDSYIEYATLHVPVSAINAYKTTAPWSSFKDIIPISGGQMQKCATPTISIENSKVKFSCETEGVKFVSSITALDSKNYNDSELTLSYKYKVTVYATKEGFEIGCPI